MTDKRIPKEDLLRERRRHSNQEDDQQRPRYHLQPDHRLPPPGTYPSTPISLISADYYATHFLLLVPPSSDLSSTVLADAKQARVATSHIPAEDVVERAMENRTLTHISNGPSGGIWVVAPEKPEVVACLVAEMQGGWELLGVGKGGNEGMIFLRHPCGFGTEQEEEEEEEEEEEKKKHDKTERANVEKNRWNRERGGEEGRAWESEEEDSDEGRAWDSEYEDSDEEGIAFAGHYRARFQDVERGRAARRDQQRELDRNRITYRGQEVRRRPRNRDPGERIPAADNDRDFEDIFGLLDMEEHQGRRG